MFDLARAFPFFQNCSVGLGVLNEVGVFFITSHWSSIACLLLSKAQRENFVKMMLTTRKRKLKSLDPDG